MSRMSVSYSVLRAFRVSSQTSDVLRDIERKASEWRWFKTKEGLFFVQTRDYNPVKHWGEDVVTEVSKKELIMARSRAHQGGCGDSASGQERTIVWVKDPDLVKEGPGGCLQPVE